MERGVGLRWDFMSDLLQTLSIASCQMWRSDAGVRATRETSHSREKSQQYLVKYMIKMSICGRSALGRGKERVGTTVGHSDLWPCVLDKNSHANSQWANIAYLSQQAHEKAPVLYSDWQKRATMYFSCQFPNYKATLISCWATITKKVWKSLSR